MERQPTKWDKILIDQYPKCIQNSHNSTGKKTSNMGLKKGRGSEKTFFQRRHTDDQEVHDTMLTITNHSVQFRSSVMSDSFRPLESQHTRPPCPSPTPGVYSNTCPSSWWCHPAISSSVIPFSSCPRSFPASGSFPLLGSANQNHNKISPHSC